MKIYKDIHSAYLGSLGDVYDNPDFTCEPRGQRIREKLYYKFQIENPVKEVIVTHDTERNKKIESYTNKECELYDSGSSSAEDFGKASKFWLQLANPDGTVNSAYGHLIKHKKSHGHPMFELHDEMTAMTREAVSEFLGEASARCMRTPWQWCVDSLKADKDTRQAVMRFSLPEHFYKGNKDMTCTLDGNWHIRENKLHLRINMRSNDLMLGLVYDLPWFVGLMDDMLEELKDTYPDLEKGPYTHMVDSIHIYDRDQEAILKMLGRQ